MGYVNSEAESMDLFMQWTTNTVDQEVAEKRAMLNAFSKPQDVSG